MRKPQTTVDKINKIVQDLEMLAESENYHSMSGIYRNIADLAIKHGGEEVALKIMKDVKKSGGWIG